jgi:hypothetical protein
MADSVLFVGWNRAVPGREQQALDLFGKAMEYYGQLQADGKIESFEPVMLVQHGGDLNGFVLIKGDRKKLGEVQREETFINYSIEAGYCLQGFGIVSGVIGDRLTETFTKWSELIT